MRKTIVSAAIAVTALTAGAVAIAAETVTASESDQHPPHRHWHFDGPFGTYDRAAAQRGYQIYAEVCSACHSLSLLAYRNLMELDLTENKPGDALAAYKKFARDHPKSPYLEKVRGFISKLEAAAPKS